MEFDKEKASIFIVKEQFSLAFGKVIQKNKENLCFLMEIFSKGSLGEILDIMVCIGIKMEILMKEHGRMMSNKDLVTSTYPIINLIKVSLLKAINMGKEFINGLMEMFMKAHS